MKKLFLVSVIIISILVSNCFLVVNAKEGEKLLKLNFAKAIEVEFKASGTCFIQNESYTYSTSSYIISNDRILIDSDFLFRILDTFRPGIYSFKYPDDRTVEISSSTDDVKFIYYVEDYFVDAKNIAFPRKIQTLDACPIKKNGKIYIPIRDVMEKYSYKVLWNPSMQEPTGVNVVYIVQ